MLETLLIMTKEELGKLLMMFSINLDIELAFRFWMLQIMEFHNIEEDCLLLGIEPRINILDSLVLLNSNIKWLIS